MEIINEIMPFIKAHPVLNLAWLGLLVVIIYLTIQARFSRVKMVNNTELVTLMNTKNAIIVDTRPGDSFKRGHITTACNIVPTDIEKGCIKNIEKFTSKPIVVVCENGLSAATSAKHLVNAGFIEVYYLKDGISGWNGDNLPLVKK